MSALPMFEEGTRTETVEYGERYLRDCAFGRAGQIRGKHHGADPYDGAFYPGGPKTFEIVQRTIVTYTGPWEPS